MKKVRKSLALIGLLFGLVLITGCGAKIQEEYQKALTAETGNQVALTLTIDQLEMSSEDTENQAASMMATGILNSLTGSELKGKIITDDKQERMQLDLEFKMLGTTFPIELLLDQKSETAYLATEVYQQLLTVLGSFMGGMDVIGDDVDTASLEGKYLALPLEDLQQMLPTDGAEEADAAATEAGTLLQQTDLMKKWLLTLDKDTFTKEGDRISHTFTKKEFSDFASYAKKNGDAAAKKLADDFVDSLKDIQQLEVASTVNRKTHEQDIKMTLASEQEGAKVTAGLSLNLIPSEKTVEVTLPAEGDIISEDELEGLMNTSYTEPETLPAEEEMRFTDEEFDAWLAEFDANADEFAQEELTGYIDELEDYLTESQYQKLLDYSQSL
ncbi:hypothetical protein [Enterococcus diestrammenae]|uniref:hypothetical protein n=1 Tax=Enterococcus diestrammenae TaxID=1155073 RepID=UPI0022E08A11|nr:hypothetical protein [Enterococcus diestrammenae]